MARVASSTRSVAKFSENLLLNSGDLSNASWGRNALTWAANQIANPIDGAVTAGAMVDNSTNTTHFARQVNPSSITARLGSMVTQSALAKAGSKSWFAIGPNNGGQTVWFDLANGVVGSIPTAAAGIRDFGSGWWQCWATYVLTTATPVFYPAPSDNTLSYAGDGSNAVYLYAPMLHSGRSPGLPTITGASATTGPIRTMRQALNLVTYSSALSRWTATGCAVTDNAIADPLTGALTASSISDDTSNGAHNIGSSNNIFFSADAVMCQSFMAKLAPGSATRYVSFGGAPQAFFDLQTGAVTNPSATVIATRMVDLGGGWWRCASIFAVSPSTTTTVGIFLSTTDSGSPPTYTGSGAPCVYLTRAQMVYANREGSLLTTLGVPVGSAGTTASSPAATGIALRNDVSGRVMP